MATEATTSYQPQPIAFDRRFVYGALLIGGGYAAIVSGIGWTIGKEVAGVAGVALTALATAIFKQYETLQFKAQADISPTIVAIPKFNLWFLLTLTAAFLGFQILLGGYLPGLVFISLGYFDEMITFEDFGKFIMEHRILLAVLPVVSHALAGFIFAKGRVSTSLSYAVIASVLSNVFQLLSQVAGMLVQDPTSIKLFLEPSFYVFGVFWLFYALAALAGAKIGMKSSA